MILHNNLLLVVDFLDQYKADKGWDQTNCRSIAKSGLIAYGNVFNENTPIRRGIRSFLDGIAKLQEKHRAEVYFYSERLVASDIQNSR